MNTCMIKTNGFNLFVLAVNLGILLSCSAGDLAIGHFGGTNFGDWTVAGTAFNSGLAASAQFAKLGIENARDNQVVSSEIAGDEPTGTLTSPEFKITRKYISFLISGGDYERDTCINLLINGQIVKSATGWRSNHLVPASWDVSRWHGQKAQIQIVDAASGDWGHINVDHIIQTDKPERLPVETGPLYRESLRPQFHFTARQWTMDRLLQAIGRVIRSETDQGVVLLIDARFNETRYRRLFPPWWKYSRVRNSDALHAAIGSFWQRWQNP